MKKTLLVFFVLLSGLAFAFMNTPQNDAPVQQIETAIKGGNASALATHFNSTIDLIVPNNEGTFSKTQAEQIIKKFFTDNPVADFEHKQQGSSQGGAVFVIGKLNTKNNKSFRVYFLMKKSPQVFKLQQLQIEAN